MVGRGSRRATSAIPVPFLRSKPEVWATGEDNVKRKKRVSIDRLTPRTALLLPILLLKTKLL